MLPKPNAPSNPKVIVNPKATQGTIMEVLYPFVSKTPHNLTISANERVILQERHQNGWSVVRNGRGEVGLVPTNYIRPVQMTMQPTFKTPKQFDPSLYNSVGQQQKVQELQSLTSVGNVSGGQGGGGSDSLNSSARSIVSPTLTSGIKNDAEKRLLAELGLDEQLPDSDDEEAPGSPGNLARQRGFASSPRMLSLRNLKEGGGGGGPGSLIPMHLPSPVAVPVAGTGGKYVDPLNISLTGSMNLGTSQSFIITSPTTTAEAERRRAQEEYEAAVKQEMDCLATLSELSSQIALGSKELAVIKRNIVVLSEDHRRVDAYIRHCEAFLKGDSASGTLDSKTASPVIQEYVGRLVKEVESELIVLRGKRDSLQHRIDENKKHVSPPPQSQPVLQQQGGSQDDGNESESTASSSEEDEEDEESDIEFVEQVPQGEGGGAGGEVEEIEEIDEENIVEVPAVPETIEEEEEIEFDPQNPTLSDQLIEEATAHDPSQRKILAKLLKKILNAREAQGLLQKQEAKLNKKLAKVEAAGGAGGAGGGGEERPPVTDEELAAAEAEVVSLAASLTEREAHLESLAMRTQELESQIEPLQKLYNKHEKKLTAGLAENKSLQEAIHALLQEREELTAQRNHFQATMDHYMGQRDGLYAERTLLQTKLVSEGAQIKQQVAVMQEKLDSLRAKCSAYSSELEALKAAAAGAK
eukprot:PhF_6_TR6082/c0_g1_i1/m.8866